MQTLFEAASHIAQEIDRTRQHLVNLEQALEGLKPLITVEAAATTLTYAITSQSQRVEDLTVVNADAPAKRRAKSKSSVEPEAEDTKPAKTRGRKAKVVHAEAVVPEPAAEPVKLPATGAKLWLKCIGRKKVSVAQIADAALKKLKLDDSAKDVITSRVKVWAYLAVKKGELVVAGTRDGAKLYQLAAATDGNPVQSVQPVHTADSDGVAPAEVEPVTETDAAA
jgi:hypothetical protein